MRRHRESTHTSTKKCLLLALERNSVSMKMCETVDGEPSMVIYAFGFRDESLAVDRLSSSCSTFICFARENEIRIAIDCAYRRLNEPQTQLSTRRFIIVWWKMEMEKIDNTKTFFLLLFQNRLSAFSHFL